MVVFKIWDVVEKACGLLYLAFFIIQETWCANEIERQQMWNKWKYFQVSWLTWGTVTTYHWGQQLKPKQIRKNVKTLVATLMSNSIDSPSCGVHLFCLVFEQQIA